MKASITVNVPLPVPVKSAAMPVALSTPDVIALNVMSTEVALALIAGSVVELFTRLLVPLMVISPAPALAINEVPVSMVTLRLLKVIAPVALVRIPPNAVSRLIVVSTKV